MPNPQQLITTTTKDGGSVDNAGAIIDHLNIWTAAIKKRGSQGRGSSKKIELHGIKKLRELILELAVRGLLVPQDPNDEPASVLLEKIAAEKEQLIKDKKIKKPKKLNAISKEDMFGKLPQGWEYVRLNDLGEWGAGATPRRGNSELYGGTIPWFKSGELVGDYIDSSEESVTKEALKQSSLRLNKVGDVLLAMYGATIGKTSILKVEATTNQAVCACTTFSGFSNVYLLTLLKAYKPRFIGMGAGGAQPNISREKIIATVVALPPEDEQPRIVAKVDELMALCDQLEQQTESSLAAQQTLVETLLNSLLDAAQAYPGHASGISDDTNFDLKADTKRHKNKTNSDPFQHAWQRIWENFDVLFTTEHSIDQLKQTILQLAVMGKLVPQNENDEPASVLLEKIAAEKEQMIKDGKIKKQKPLPEISDDEKPFELPKGWEWARIGDLLSLKNGYAFKSKYFCEVKSDYILTTPGNFYEEGGFRTRGDKTKFYDGPIEPEFVFEINDLIIPMTEQAPGLLGSAAFIPDDRNLYIHNQRLGKLTPYHSSITKQYLYLFFNAPYLRKCLAATCTGTTVRHTSPDRILSVLVPVMSENEQVRVVNKVKGILKLFDPLKDRIRESQTTQLHLADAMAEQALN